MGWPTSLFIDGANTIADAENITIYVKNSILSGMATHFDATDATFKTNMPAWFAGNNGRTFADSSDIVTDYALGQNYPNPFNPSTTISFAMPDPGLVKLYVYNQLGQQVADLVKGHQQAGRHHISWNATNLPNGIYMYQLEVNNIVHIKKMLLVK